MTERASDAEFDLFFSYKYDNGEFIEKIFNIFENKYRIWNKKRSKEILNVETWGRKGILNSKLFICFLSRKYCNSFECKSQFNYAMDNINQKFICVMMEDFTVPPPFDIYMRNSIMINVFKNLNQNDLNANFNLLEHIQKIISPIISELLNTENISTNPINPIQSVSEKSSSIYDGKMFCVFKKIWIYDILMRLF